MGKWNSFEFPAAGVVAAVHLPSGFLSRAVFMVAVTLACAGASVTAEERDSDLGVTAVVLMIRHLGRRNSNPHPGPLSYRSVFLAHSGTCFQGSPLLLST